MFPSLSKTYPFIMSAIQGKLTPQELSPKTVGIYFVFSGGSTVWIGQGEIQKGLINAFKDVTISTENPDSFSFVECEPDSLAKEYERWLSALKPKINNPRRQ